MDDIAESLILLMAVVSVLLRIDALFLLYIRREKLHIVPGLVLSFLSPVVALSAFAYVTSKGFDEGSRGRNGLGKAFIGSLLFLISQMAAGWLFLTAMFVSSTGMPAGRAVGPASSAQGFTHSELFFLVAASAAIGISLFWVIYGGFNLRRMLRGRNLVRYSGLALFLFLILSLAINMGMALLGLEEAVSSQVFPEPDGFLDIFLAVLSIAVIAPLAEEIVFRGYIFRAVENKAGGYVAIILTALAFAILHFSPVLFIPIFLMGLAMGWVRERTGSIVPSLIFHSANNLSAVVLISVS